MQLAHRRILSYALLATYAGISMLGHGLHELMPGHGHHHHHGAAVVGHSCHEPAHHHHHHHHCGDCHCDDQPADAVLAASEGEGHSHTCQVCEFLSRAISRPVEVTASIDWQPVAVASVILPQSVYSPTTVGPHAPRGPPVLL